MAQNPPQAAPHERQLNPSAQECADVLIAQGRDPTAAEVVTDDLHLVADREQKRVALRKMINDAIKEGGELTVEEVDAVLEAAAEQQRERSIPE